MRVDAAASSPRSSSARASFAAIMDSPVTGRRSPRNNYHRIDLCATDPTELSGASSPGASSLKRFACQFDPGSKNGRVLVLLFDRNGDSEFKEMSRLDVLRMTQQAAVPREEEPEEVGEAADIAPAMPLRRLGSVGAKGRRTSMSVMRGDGGGPDGPNYATVCDVQVGGSSSREEVNDAGGLDGYCVTVGDGCNARGCTLETFGEWRTRSQCRMSRRSLFGSRRFSSALVRMQLHDERGGDAGWY